MEAVWAQLQDYQRPLHRSQRAWFDISFDSLFGISQGSGLKGVVAGRLRNCIKLGNSIINVHQMQVVVHAEHLEEVSGSDILGLEKEQLGFQIFNCVCFSLQIHIAARGQIPRRIGLNTPKGPITRNTAYEPTPRWESIFSTAHSFSVAPNPGICK